jgi:hypothetical protein
VPLAVNPNEIAAVEYVSAANLVSRLAEWKAQGVPVSPWFDLIGEKFLLGWWARLDEILQRGGLDDPEIVKTIHRLNDTPSGAAQAAATILADN